MYVFNTFQIITGRYLLRNPRNTFDHANIIESISPVPRHREVSTWRAAPTLQPNIFLLISRKPFWNEINILLDDIMEDSFVGRLIVYHREVVPVLVSELGRYLGNKYKNIVGRNHIPTGINYIYFWAIPQNVLVWANIYGESEGKETISF